ncbi:PWWP-DOMAIN INTERACTOR OF POLYCOMBS1, PRO-TRP-PRO-TRP protein 1 [Hibiscus trionum]|uniref:PWWP-DOMAIN INTERACTOR OF POLYCOMBS1, PRO-TRP-PRO-TRP protein 1 n=1 Tax=Hibiscus trionum TaxID=183268 RepID=A0A9W7HJP5_HIBTR|nr:PWWP-DOMAIN INTERACTOR OF POLYCOMBS1, PRO-TRP-PRO-TRP protein 1 [Hibiscus trionum]
MESGPGSDGGVGSIVWVRRRNGSWWPGKILGPEELPTSQLMSPRTGTPVKLLGREDASVDWYNLEKSKRVKAFRCGEFNDCIERAESSQGMPPKKREKYARREDAILHALELEKELLKKQGNFDRPSYAKHKSSGSAKKDSGGSDISNGKPGNSKSNQSRSQDTSTKGETVSSTVHLKEQMEYQPSWKNNSAENLPRMRGLQDLGLRTAYAKQKPTSFGAMDVDETLSPSSKVSIMGRINHINGERRRGVSQAKRSRRMYFPPESFDALGYKGIPPNQIEMSPPHFVECDSYPFPSHMIEDNTSEFLEDVESGSSESTSYESESESDSSETEPDMDDDMTSHSGATVCKDVRLGAFQRPDTLGGGSIGQGDSDESSLSGEMSHFYTHDHLSMNEAVSKWQLKGKRKMRTLTKRSMDAAEVRGYDGSAHGIYHDERGAFRRSLGHSSLLNHDFNDDVDATDLSAKDFGAQMVRFDDRRYLRTPRDTSRRGFSFNHNITDWEGMPWENNAAVEREWEDKLWNFDPIFAAHRNFRGKRRSMLMDVDLEVQASYKKQPVPIVSLISKLDGKAIIGHPIQIEALEDSSTETLLPTNGYFSNGLNNHDGNTSLPPAWRTAKRTNFRVPRPHPPFALGSYEVAEYQSLDHEGKPPFKKYNTGTSDYKAGLVKKSIHHVPRSPTDRKFQKKLPKKVSLFSSQKTRALSSIGIEHSLGLKPIHDSDIHQMDGLIKPESSGPTTVACIPVKLVFSRLLEKINRPPSKAASKVIFSTSDAVRDPS